MRDLLFGITGFIAFSVGFTTPTGHTVSLHREYKSLPSGEVNVNIPLAWREQNYGSGSCVHASTIMLLRWGGQHELADWWRNNHRGGEYADRLHRKLDAANLRYAYTTTGDVSFLEWAINTRRGAGITYFPNHYVLLIDLTETHATILDNNELNKLIKIPRETFIRNWRNYGGWATAIVYDPIPPLPYL